MDERRSRRRWQYCILRKQSISTRAIFTRVRHLHITARTDVSPACAGHLHLESKKKRLALFIMTTILVREPPS